MNVWQARISHALEARESAQAYRIRQVAQQNDHCLNFASNDYLGLAHSPELIQIWQKGAELYGVGSGGSGHVTGYHEPLQQLETQLAEWLGYERAIVYSSGFAANQALIQLLIEKNDWIIADKLSHASLVEAAMNSEGNFKRFAHNDLDSLKHLLNKVDDDQAVLAITEGIFSMDGDEAPLYNIQAISERNRNNWLMVDDAHGIGVHGKEGKGTCDKHGIHPEILVVTFGKALGVKGAAILCSDSIAEYLVQKSRALIYSTAIPPAQAYTLLASIEIVQKSDAQRQYLQDLIRYFKAELQTLGIENQSNSAIQPIIIGSNEESLRVSEVLKEHNIWAMAIRPPTVPVNSARIRMTLNTNHTQENIDHVIGALRYAIGG